MDLILVGLNHKTAPIEVREKVAFREDAIPLALETLLKEFGFDEAMIVSTCNRVELLASAGPDHPERCRCRCPARNRRTIRDPY